MYIHKRDSKWQSRCLAVNYLADNDRVQRAVDVDNVQF
jgi:hypothetical protein